MSLVNRALGANSVTGVYRAPCLLRGLQGKSQLASCPGRSCQDSLAALLLLPFPTRGSQDPVRSLIFSSSTTVLGDLRPTPSNHLSHVSQSATASSRVHPALSPELHPCLPESAGEAHEPLPLAYPTMGSSSSHIHSPPPAAVPAGKATNFLLATNPVPFVTSNLPFLAFSGLFLWLPSIPPLPGNPFSPERPEVPPFPGPTSHNPSPPDQQSWKLILIRPPGLSDVPATEQSPTPAP